MPDGPARFVLIHGGGSGSWDWHLVAARLRERGHDVHTPDLPIGEPDNEAADYAEAVIAGIDKPEDLVVVGHSFGGFTAPIVADRLAARLLVFVAAMVPRPGEAPGEWWHHTGHDRLGVEFDTPEQVVEVFMRDVPPELVTEALAHGRDQAGGWSQPWPLDRMPDLPTRFLLCRQDRLFPPEFQRRVVRDRLGIVPDEMDGSHAVFLSRPVELADRLEAYWRDLP